MKRTTFFLGAAVTILIVAGLSGYFGHQAGYRQALSLKKSSLVSTLDALERLRAGDPAGATILIEQDCFLSAVEVLGEEHHQSDIVIRGVTSRLISYRQTYRTNRTEWTPIEHKLDGLLSQRR
jgi:hypothetical protein